MRVLTSALTTALFALLIAGSTAPQASAQTLSGGRAPSFALPNSEFKRFDILDYRGKWLLLNFTSTDKSQCADCPAVSKRLDEFRKKNTGKVDVLTIVVAPPENLQTVSAYIKATGITNPVVFDQGQVTASYFKATPQNSKFDTPHVFAIDPQGKIVQDWGQVGAASPRLIDELTAMIK